ncbi:MetQ/NlpA family ABC transporter substrate-binding protein [Acetilactobacillus jinshanensis]|uniref:ABC transporter substrate-binding protein n=1 Tax=Acetilactobacillus jinshanensis TaxID=1720083 RepID=A0A4P6ZLZ3_9LACO|nr:MetQ/NlpA family ABC transporter substrate-binding protein [Acetilactobacillus jinshanensis]QBP18432.1 ABC transporter substrate-binding protein [Acetilactobacillus jinshanensis]URL61303.1 ABC transporter substrate-binding protein [uncultured bacterium]
MKFKIHSFRSWFLIIAVLVLGLLCFQGIAYNHSIANDKIIKVGVIGTNDNPIWNAVNHKLAKKHIYVKTIPFANGIQVDRATNDGQLNLNACQHYAFMNNENKSDGFHLVSVGQTYIQPLNIYSKHLKNIHHIKDHGSIAIPNDSTNAGRALDVLQHAGLIKLNPKKGIMPTPQDIISNPKHLKIEEVDAGAIMKLLPDFSAGITNSNFVQANHKNPVTDSIYRINPNPKLKVNKPWINIIITKKSQRNNLIYKEIVRAYHTPAVIKVIHRLYKDVSYPAFNA